MTEVLKFMSNRIPAVLIPAIFATMLIINGAAFADNSAASAESFIEVLATEAVKSLASADIGTTERRKRFRRIMLKNFAFNRIARWALGRYWRRASAVERYEYL